MVDKDRIKGLVGGGDSNESDSRAGKSEEAAGGGSNTSRSSSHSEGEMTRSQKLEELKGGSSSASSGGGTEPVKRLLFTGAAMHSYIKTLQNSDVGEGSQQVARVKNDLLEDLSGEIINFLGVHKFDQIADEYGYSWDSILSRMKNNKDMSGSSLQTNPGDPSKSHVKELLMGVANIMLYVEGIKLDVEGKSDPSPREEIKGSVASGVAGYFEEIVSRNEVQRIAEQHGFDWEQDIIQGVLEDQDFESKIEGY